MDHTLHPTCLSIHRERTFLYGPFSMVLSLWSFLYGPFSMDLSLWSFLYGLYNHYMYEQKCLLWRRLIIHIRVAPKLYKNFHTNKLRFVRYFLHLAICCYRFAETLPLWSEPISFTAICFLYSKWQKESQLLTQTARRKLHWINIYIQL